MEEYTYILFICIHLSLRVVSVIYACTLSFRRSHRMCSIEKGVLKNLTKTAVSGSLF